VLLLFADPSGGAV